MLTIRDVDLLLVSGSADRVPRPRRTAKRGRSGPGRLDGERLEQGRGDERR